MRLKIINSGSVGNCYILENKDTALIIECGVPFKEIKMALDFNFAKVAGVLISHSHQDHCKSVEDVIEAGMYIYCSGGAFTEMKIPMHRVCIMKPMMHYFLGKQNEWMIMPFDVKHDAAEPLGFLIKHEECGTVLFITDSYYVPYTFRGLNNIMVEANYCNEILERRMKSNSIHGKVYNRVKESHMSISTCIEMLQKNDLSAVNNIILLHLSEGNADAKDFQHRVKEATGKNVIVAGKNMEINFSKTPF